MCLLTRTPKASVADKDIVCYKQFIGFKDKTLGIRLMTPVMKNNHFAQSLSAEEGIIEADMPVQAYKPLYMSFYKVEHGIHTYNPHHTNGPVFSSLELAIPYIGNNASYATGVVLSIKGIIPKGTRYYEEYYVPIDIAEYCSDKIQLCLKEPDTEGPPIEFKENE